MSSALTLGQLLTVITDYHNIAIIFSAHYFFRWYRANYSMAEPLAWGQNTGCIIPHGSCGEWIETQQQKLVVHVMWHIPLWLT